ncbi:LysM peptidoglycan-binding domain-containing protein [Arthrobacter sp. GMC3]|uniref:lytic transglycosylase n=1 Tax=Arthrobacter sp. GMC3 TaxID=2058894 RepID=UPI000CE37142|nr:LysM peptidoglycan-binding domain-containing protein [Arthrobacter sp. GMC3]
MTSNSPSRTASTSAKQLAAVATAAIPVVMLSSMAMAQPAAASPVATGTKILPAVITASGIATEAKASKIAGIPTAVVAGSIPTRMAVQTVATPQSHTVVAGDTVSGIAAQYSLSTDEILAANGITADTLIYPGEQISLGGSAQSAPEATATPLSSSAAYVIAAGDTLSAIAAKHGVDVQALAGANNMGTNATIYAGKTLSIPGVGAASSSITPIAPASPSAPVDPSALTPDQQVPSTFLHYTYPDAVVADANQNKAALMSAPVPTRAQMQEMVASTAASMGVDPSLALAVAQQESSFNHQSVSPANAIGTMQVIPDAGEWASGLVGRQLNLLQPEDNVVAGVAIIRALLQGAPSEDLAIAGYYQGQYSVSVNGMFADTVNYVAGINAKRNSYR